MSECHFWALTNVVCIVNVFQPCLIKWMCFCGSRKIPLNQISIAQSAWVQGVITVGLHYNLMKACRFLWIWPSSHVLGPWLHLKAFYVSIFTKVGSYCSSLSVPSFNLLCRLPPFLWWFLKINTTHPNNILYFSKVNQMLVQYNYDHTFCHHDMTWHEGSWVMLMLLFVK